MTSFAMASPLLDVQRRSLAAMTEGRVSWHLWNWEQWMFKRDWRRLWYPSKASGGMGRSGHYDFDEMVGAVDRRCARAVDAIINGLPFHQRLAIHHKHLASVYRGRCMEDLETSYADGVETLGRELARKGIE